MTSVVAHYDTLHEMKRLNLVSRRPLSYTNPQDNLRQTNRPKIGLKSCNLTEALLTPTGGSNLTFKVSFYFCISNDYLTFVTLAWSTKPVLSRWSIFVAIANNTLYGSKLYIFLFMPKIISILSKDHVPLIYFVNFLL